MNISPLFELQCFLYCMRKQIIPFYMTIHIRQLNWITFMTSKRIGFFIGFIFSVSFLVIHSHKRIYESYIRHFLTSSITYLFFPNMRVLRIILNFASRFLQRRHKVIGMSLRLSVPMFARFVQVTVDYRGTYVQLQPQTQYDIYYWLRYWIRSETFLLFVILIMWETEKCGICFSKTTILSLY